MSVHVDIEIKKNGSIKSNTEGCGCCSYTNEVSLEDAIEEIEDAIKELNIQLELLNKLKEKSE